MATTYTSRAKLAKPALNDSGWSTPLNANADALDAVAAVGGLAVTTTEVPSAALTVAVAAGSFRASTGLFMSYAGSSSQAVGASATTCLWLTDAGALTTGSAFPATFHVPLASVVAGSSTVTSITDARKPLTSGGANLNTVYLALAGGSLADAANVALGTGTGTKVGTSASQKLGLWGVTPVAQPSGAAQAAVGALTAVAITDGSTGTASTTIAALSDAPTANAVASLAAQLNHAVADLAALRTLVNALQAAGVASGAWKGSV